MTLVERVAQTLAQAQPISEIALAKRLNANLFKVRKVLDDMRLLQAAYQETPDGPWLLTRKAERVRAGSRPGA